MSGYDYGNARLRAMKSRLLSRRELEALAETGSLPGLIAALTRTAYRKAIEAAITRTTGLDTVSEALRMDLLNSLGRLAGFYSDPERDLVMIVLRAYEVRNLKAILQGLAQNAPANEIAAALFPVGQLRESLLGQLVRAATPRAAIDLLASMRLPHARPLLALRLEHARADAFDMELALERWHYEEALGRLRESRLNAGVLDAALQLEADLANLLVVLRFVHAPAERDQLAQRYGSRELRHLFVGPGRLPFELLSHASNQPGVEAAIATLEASPYATALRDGLGDYSHSGRLSAFESTLARHRLRWLAGLVSTNSLGIGLPLGYVALKTNEVRNIRWVAQGINLGLKAGAIQEGLEFAL